MDSIPGIAHLCEHVMFMGTDCFKQHLKENNGSNNAFTSLHHTNFYFDVSPEAFANALKMLVKFSSI